LKTAYLHTAVYHPTHGAYAKSVGAEFIRIDKYLPYFTDKNQSRVKRYVSMLINILFSPARKYDIIITDEARPEAAIIKLTSFRKKKLIATQASYTLTKVHEKKLSPLSLFFARKAINYYDGIICVGEELFQIAQKVCAGNKGIKIRKTFNGVNNRKAEVLSTNQYNSSSNTIVSICNCFSEDTYTYKAVDIMVDVFDKLLINHPNLNFIIIGKYIPLMNDRILSRYKIQTQERIKFFDFDDDILKYFRQGVLYMQLSRKEAFGVAVIEAAFAGLPVYISDQVGARVMLDELGNKNDFIINNENVKEAVQKVDAFLCFNEQQKKAVSDQMRYLVKSFTESNASRQYKTLFEEIIGTKSSGMSSVNSAG